MRFSYKLKLSCNNKSVFICYQSCGNCENIMKQFKLLHHFSWCECFWNFQFHQIKNRWCIRFVRCRFAIVLNVSKCKNNGIKWKSFTIICPLIDETQINLVRGSIVQQKYLYEKLYGVVLMDLTNYRMLYQILIDFTTHTEISWLLDGFKTLAR